MKKYCWHKELRKEKLIPDTHIETDSYAACQLIEKQGKLDFESLKYMSETVEGNFTFSVLDDRNNLYIELAFEQSEKEIMDLRLRTKEGIETARLNGKQIGNTKGIKLNIKKEAPAKELIRKHCKTFGGTLNDIECCKLANISRNTYYKYKAEIKAEFNK
jgi:DNA invertase Pin-like site-specific DNA recombinase